jgi:hypothetical protein
MQGIDLLEAKKKYNSEGLNFIPCTEGKYPIGAWAEYQQRFMTDQEFLQLCNGGAHGGGIVCGNVSGGYEVLDVDHKYCTKGTLRDDYLKLIEDNRPELYKRLRIYLSKTKGPHIPYRCSVIEDNKKIARRHSTPAEKENEYWLKYNAEISGGASEEKAIKEAEKAKNKVKVLIETRGEGGFIVCPPTPGYEIFQDNPIPDITPEEREFLFNAAHTFNEVYEVYKEPAAPFTGISPYEKTPWDDYNEQGDIITLLERHDWQVHPRKDADHIYLTRPGKSIRDGWSADFHTTKRLFKCWSTSNNDFDEQHAYTPASVFRILECNGDRKKASAELEKQGYGKRKLLSQKSDERENGNTTTFQKSEKSPEPATLESFDNLLVTKEKDIPQPEPIVSIHGGSFAIAGNISSIGAAPKSAKTTIAVAMTAGAISETGDIDGFPDIKVNPNTDRKAVLYIDTEQSEADQQHQVRIALKRAGLETTPDFFRCYNLVSLDYKKYMEVTDTLCGLLSEKFGGIHLIVVDGGADFISSVNDEVKSVEVVQYFRHLSIRYQCPVIIIVHQNPGGDKERGHFGSEVQRKCYGLLSIEKKGEIFTIQPKMMRRAGNAEVPLIQFQYSLERGYHVQVDAGDQEAAKDSEKWEKLKTLAHEVFKPFDSYREIEAYSAIMQHTKKGVSTAKGMLYNMRGFGILKQSADKLYRLNMDNRSVGQNRSESRSDNL